MKGQKIYNKSLIKLLIAYTLFTGIIACVFLFFLVVKDPLGIAQKKPHPSPTTVITVPVSPTHITTPIQSTPTTPPKTQGKFCGGIAGIPCPTGSTCKLSGNYPDAGGTCIKKVEATTQPEQTMCTMEAKECPDGSYVGRSGPKCEFTPCPKGI